MSAGIVFAVLGTVMVGFGSFVATAAPGDGQTGCVCFPLWFFGGLFEMVSLVGALAQETPRGERTFICSLAMVAVGSVFVSYLASQAYGRKRGDPTD